MKANRVTKKEERTGYIVFRIIGNVLSLFLIVTLIAMAACVLIAVMQNISSFVSLIGLATVTYMVITMFVALGLYLYLFYSLTKKEW